jgi:hypothetical protein
VGLRIPITGILLGCARAASGHAEDHLPRYRTDATVASWSSDALAVVGKQHPVMARDQFTAEGPRLSH